MSEPNEVTINVPVLARVEGEGGLQLRIRQGRVDHVALKIFEPPRLFEKLLEGRLYSDVPDAVARICGICPVAYQMSAVHAIESAWGMNPGPWVRNMRRLLYCGEWIESHSLHIHLLAAPDFFGCENVVRLAQKAPDAVKRGLRLQGLGNDIIRLLGGRSVHPVGVCVGGFTRAPLRNEVAALRDKLIAALPDAEALLRWTATWPLPRAEEDFLYIALQHPTEYPFNEGEIVSSRGERIAAEQFEQHFVEHQVPHSTALHCLYHGEPYLVGPLARVNINFTKLAEPVRNVLQQIGWTVPNRNMYHSVIARAAEIFHGLIEAIACLENYEMPDAPNVPATPKAGSAAWCTEAPRGLLWHRYELDADGRVLSARIVPPTSQNQARIEADLRARIEADALSLQDDALRHFCETIIRNYDPCISCATHFLTLDVRREGP
jgi:coenzyme F420-reducing hydrogenase alpha subunit